MLFNDVSDDLTIANEEKLWRLILPRHTSIDENTGELRPWTGNFQDVDDPLSVDISSLTTLEETFQRGSGEKVIAEFTAGIAREVGCKVIKDPKPENESHALVYGHHKKGGPTGSEAKKISKKSKVISHPPCQGNKLFFLL